MLFSVTWRRLMRTLGDMDITSPSPKPYLKTLNFNLDILTQTNVCTILPWDLKRLYQPFYINPEKQKYNSTPS